MKELTDNTAQFFVDTFQNEPDHIFLSPGRINIIGEHIDYNDGYVLPAAIDKYVCLALTKQEGSKCILVSKDLNDRFEFDLQDTLEPTEKMWANYFLGVIQQLKDRNLEFSGFKLVFSSTVPIGAGLSSSAAVECGFAFAINEMYNLQLDKKTIAFIGQKAEHTFVGVQCGIMDQFASVFGKKDHVIRLDCMTLEYDYHNADFEEYSLLLLDSKVKHAHLTSGYNDRRAEVERGLAIIGAEFSQISSFRDCNEEHLLAVKDKLGETIFRRCSFVVKEIRRVQQAVDALESSDFARLGELMYDTHNGLSSDYEVSCAETDFLVAAVRDDHAVIGARMMGGGFGGCTINLVQKGHEDRLVQRVAAEYQSQFSIELQSYKVAISDGTSQYK
ncbi:MAG TPA: galactokinase [Flavobacterium sp.]|jgi:galactokinase